MGELDLKGIAVNNEGLITVADYHGHCILLFDKERKVSAKIWLRGK